MERKLLTNFSERTGAAQGGDPTRVDSSTAAALTEHV